MTRILQVLSIHTLAYTSYSATSFTDCVYEDDYYKLYYDEHKFCKNNKKRNVNIELCLLLIVMSCRNHV